MNYLFMIAFIPGALLIVPFMLYASNKNLSSRLLNILQGVQLTLLGIQAIAVIAYISINLGG